MSEQKIDFEKALEELRRMAEQIKTPGLNLEDSLECYEKGIRYYKICDQILKDTRQKIETIETN